MKIFKSVLFICMFSLDSDSACIKNTVSVDYAGGHEIPDIILQKPSVKRGEPFFVSTNVQNPDTVIKWSIRPSDSTAIIPYGNDAFINISLAGTYLITANFYSPADTIKAYDSIHSTIIVNDSLFAPTGPTNHNYDTVSLAGDEITLIPYEYSDGIKFVAKTVNLYNCIPYISGYGAILGPVLLRHQQ